MEPATRTHLAAAQALHRHEEEENAQRRQEALQAEFFRHHPASRNGVYDAMHPYVPSTQVEVQYLPDQLAKYLKATRMVDQTWNTEYRRTFKDHVTPKRPSSSRAGQRQAPTKEKSKTDLKAQLPTSGAVAPKIAHPARRAVPLPKQVQSTKDTFDQKVDRAYVATPQHKPVWRPARSTISSRAPVGGMHGASRGVPSWGALPAGVRFMAGDSVRNVLK